MSLVQDVLDFTDLVAGTLVRFSPIDDVQGCRRGCEARSS